MSNELTHLDESGRARMVNVGEKAPTSRVAIAEGRVRMQPATLALIRDGQMKKGDVFAIAEIAGVMGGKKTSELIPLCHPLPLDQLIVRLHLDEAGSAIRIEALARTMGKTGVEMEALTAVSIAALTIYDMAKAVDQAMVIDGIRLLEKRGGSRGDYMADTAMEKQADAD